jgi:hypothetical protein
MYCNKISAASLEKHDFKANEKDPFFHECTKCNAQHDLKSNHYYEEQEPKPANCTHGNITYKKCNVCGIEFDEKEYGEKDSNKHIIDIIVERKRDSDEGDFAPEVINKVVTFKHRAYGNCKVCGEYTYVMEFCTATENKVNNPNKNEKAKDDYLFILNGDMHCYYNCCQFCGRKGTRHDEEHGLPTDDSQYTKSTTQEFSFVDSSHHNAFCICGQPKLLTHDLGRDIAVITYNANARYFRGFTFDGNKEITQVELNKHKPEYKGAKHSTYNYCILCKSGFFDDNVDHSISDVSIYSHNERRRKY